MTWLFESAKYTSPVGATAMPPGVLSAAWMAGPLSPAYPFRAPITCAVAASRSMNVPAPSARIMTRKMVALRSPYMRSSDGATSGTRAGPDFIATMPCPTVTAAIAALDDRRRLCGAPRDDRDRISASAATARRPAASAARRP